MNVLSRVVSLAATDDDDGDCCSIEPIDCGDEPDVGGLIGPGLTANSEFNGDVGSNFAYGLYKSVVRFFLKLMDLRLVDFLPVVGDWTMDEYVFVSSCLCKSSTMVNL